MGAKKALLSKKNVKDRLHLVAEYSNFNIKWFQSII